MVRQHEVLGLMVRHGFLGAEESGAAQQQVLHYTRPRYDIKAPHFSLYVRDLVESRYGLHLLYYGGLKVYTTLDLRQQEIAERVLQRHVATIAQQNASNAPLVAI